MTERKNPRTRARRRITILFVAASAVLCFLSGLIPQEPLRRLVERRLRASFGPTARLGALHVVPARLRVEVGDLMLETAAFRLELPRGRVDVSLPLLAAFGAAGGEHARRLPIRAIALESPRLVVHANRAGGGRQGTGLPLPVVEQLELTDGTFVYEGPALGGALTLRGLELRGGLAQGAVFARVRDGMWSRPVPVPLGPARVELRASPALELELVSLTSRFGGSHVEAQGPLGRAGDIAPRLKLSGSLDLADLGGFGAPGLTGSLDAKGRLSGHLEEALLELDLAGSHLELAGLKVGAARGQLSYRVGGEASASWTLDLMAGRLSGQTRLSAALLEGKLQFRDIELAEAARAMGLQLPGQGRSSGEIAWRGDPRASLDLAGSATAKGRASGQDIQASFELSGPVSFQGAGTDLSWTLSADAQASNPAGASRSMLQRAHLEARGGASGLAPLAIAGRLFGGVSVKTAGGETTDVALEGAIHGGVESASVDLEGRGLGGSLRLSIDVEKRVLRRLALEGVALDLRPLGASGTARFSFAAKGPLDHLRGDGELAVEDAAWRGVELGPLTLKVTCGDGGVVASLAAPKLLVRGQARLPEGHAPTLTGSLSFDETRLEPFAALLPRAVPLGGSLRAQLDVALPLAHPAKAQALARVESLRLESGVWSAASEGPFVLRAALDHLELSGLALRGPGLRLAASGAFGTAASASLDLEVAGQLDLGQLPGISDYKAAGLLEAQIALSGQLGRPRARGSITVRGLSVGSDRLPTLALATGSIELDGDAAVLRDVKAELAGGELEVGGRLPFAALARAARREAGQLGAGESAALLLEFRNLELPVLLEGLFRAGASPMGGRVSGRLDLEGGLTALAELRAKLQATTTGLAVEDVALETSPLELRLERSQLILADASVEGEGGRLALRAHADLAAETLDASARGALGLRALNALLPEAALAGQAQLDLDVAGPFAAPRLQGTLAIHGGTIRLRALPQPLTEVEASLAIDAGAIRIQQATALFGGGSLTLSGEASLTGMQVSELALSLSGRDVALRYPEGLRSRLDADLKLAGKPDALGLSGEVRVQSGLYDLDLALEKSLLAAPLASEPSPLFRSIALDLRLETENPVQVRNNLARLEASGSFTVRGDLETPAPVGGLDLRPGGKLFLQGREFVVDGGHLAYNGSWDPELALRAKCRLRGVEMEYGRRDVQVTITADGPLARPRLSFSSDPGSFSEAQIVNMIATNRAGSQALGSGAWVAGEQAALFLTGRLTRSLTAGLQGLGFDEVSIQPELLALETNPGARFTFGKRLTDQLGLIYSLSLNDPESRFIELDVTPWRDLSLLAQRRDDGTLTYGGGQSIQLFGPPRRSAPRTEKVALTEVRIEGEASPGEPAAREHVRAHSGDHVSDWDLQDDADRLRDKLRAEGHLEAEVTAHLQGGAAVFRVAAGPQVTWRVEGMEDAPELRATIHKALFEEEAAALGRQRLLDALHKHGHLEASVDVATETAPGKRTLVFRVTPGAGLRLEALRFPGARVLSAHALEVAAGGPARLLTAPDEAVRGIREAYRARHYLAAVVSAPELTRRSGRVSITVAVDEGAPARVEAIRFAGATDPEDELGRVTGIPVGAVYDPDLVLQAVERLQAAYFASGRPSVRIVPRVEPRGSDLDLVFEIAEGPRSSVASVELSGLSHTSESLVRRRLGFAAGDPLDPRRLAAAERNLLALGVFSRVAVTYSEGSASGVRVEVVEEPRLLARYQIRYNDDKGLSGDLDGELRNQLGRGLTLGWRYSRSRREEELRGSLQLPAVPLLGDLTGSLFRNDRNNPFEGFEGVSLRQLDKGLALQAKRALPNRWSLLYGYNLRTSVVSSDLDEFATTTKIASLDASVLRETRDNPLNARRGRFWSLNLELAPRGLGSDFDFVKGLAQGFVTRALRPSLTWAQGARLGLARVFSGEDLVFTERFHAGGGNSVRGFATDALGPRDRFGDPAGGEAVLILNEELRYMLPLGIGGVVFWDAGNVFAKASDLSFHLRHALGVGFRWDSPLGLLRIDLGFPLARRQDEKTFRAFFSLGQAF